jgi:hypothetical protein
MGWPLNEDAVAKQRALAGWRAVAQELFNDCSTNVRMTLNGLNERI